MMYGTKRGVITSRPSIAESTEIGRRDHSVAVEESGAEDPQGGQEARAALAALRHVARDQADEGEDPSFALVVGPEDYHEVLHADDEAQRPDEEGHHAEDVVGALPGCRASGEKHSRKA